MKSLDIVLFYIIGLSVGIYFGTDSCDRQPEMHTTYKHVITGTSNGCPCSFEVWKATVPINHPDLDQVDEDYWEYNGTEHWDIVLTTSECWKYDSLQLQTSE